MKTVQRYLKLAASLGFPIAVGIVFTFCDFHWGWAVFVSIVLAITFLFFTRADVSLWSNWEVFVRSSASACYLGSSLGLFFAVIFLVLSLVPKGGGWTLEVSGMPYRGALGVFISTVVLIIGLDVFYKRYRPTTNIEELIRWIDKDLADAAHESRVWFVYPALAFGYFRFYNDPRLTKKGESDHPYNLLMSKFGSMRENRNAKVIVYKRKYYRKLFEAYHLQHELTEEMRKKPFAAPQVLLEEVKQRYARDLESQKKVEKTAAEAERLLLLFPEDRRTELEPADFPPHVIVIEDTTYFLASYGLPLFKKENSDFTPIPGESYVQIFAYKWPDHSMATVISGALWHVVESFRSGVAGSE